MARQIKETSRQYDRPFRPFPIRLFNHLAGVVRAFGRLDPDALMAKARQQTGLQDFGEGFGEGELFFKAFHVLLDSLNKEAQLTPFGIFIQQTRLLAALKTRLRMTELLKAHPDILEVDLGKMIVIAGLQRTGTTTLHRLIAADPKMRSLLSWEALNPLPLAGEKPDQPEKRIKLARQAEKALAYMAPEFFAIHPVEHDAPEEDILLLDLCFMSQAPEATFYVPTYASWLEAQDHQPAYEYLKRILQILHWYQPKDNWVLKTPHHMEHIDVIVKVFPQATIVQTHRDPQKTTGSFCSMVAHGRGVFSDRVDTREVAQHWTRKVERMMHLSIKARENIDASHFVDVSYYDLLEDPMAELEKIYTAAGIEFSDAARDAIEQTRQQNTQHRYGRHVYDIVDFGLSKHGIDEQYAFYRDYFHIPQES